MEYRDNGGETLVTRKVTVTVEHDIDYTTEPYGGLEPGTVPHSIAVLEQYGLYTEARPDGTWAVSKVWDHTGEMDIAAECDTEGELEALAFGVVLGVAAVR